MEEISTDKIELAASFVNSTSSNIFLTGKAGTGKTTFLEGLAKATHKNFLIVAPTGVAALNANGVTIHSQFLFPFGTFLLNGARFSTNPHGNFFDRHQLVRRNPLNSERKQVLRNIDLLVIDEVSMLRADLLDAIDYRLKSVKNNFNRPFGGVQLLMIGDLFQLPPIVKEYEWEYLKNTYSSMHFFEARAWKKSSYVHIELDKIFRQRDEDFINILNNIRNNSLTDEDLTILNSRFQAIAEDEDVITITTHNNIAQGLNRKKLDQLSGRSFFYEAEINGDFPENLYPLNEQLELRVGAKVMFVKNDFEGDAYYNGKLAEVIELTQDKIFLKMEGEDYFELRKHNWENKKYTINSTSKEIEENIVGTFTQFPIKLAWAITVHKSQGLTFDKAIIDVGQAFAPGQVYVALSRLRSLEGLILRTPISKDVVSNDGEVVRFSKNQPGFDSLKKRLKTEQVLFLKNFLQSTFDFSSIISQIEYTQKKTAEKTEFEDEEMRMALDKLKTEFLKQQPISNKFKVQVHKLLEIQNNEKLLERIEKAQAYFLQLLTRSLKELFIHLGEVQQFSRTKTYQNLLQEIDQLIAKKAEHIQKAGFLSGCVIHNRKIQFPEAYKKPLIKMREKALEETKDHLAKNPKTHLTKTGRKRKQSIRGETYQTTFALLGEGLDIEEIAEKRDLAVSTIEGHVAKGILNGVIAPDQVISKEEFQAIGDFFKDDPETILAPIFEKTGGKYSYGKLRMVRAAMQWKLKQQEQSV